VPGGGEVYLTFLRNVWGSFSARSLVIWSPQVAGGDEPPSVLSDNLLGSGSASRTFLHVGPPCCPPASYLALSISRLSDQRSQIGLGKCCAPKMIGPTVESGSFPFRYQTGGNGMPGGRAQETLGVSAEIARPFAELRWTGALPGTSRAKRRWRNQRISLTSGEERVLGVKRSQRCVSSAA
jgi:hypothetical protein